MLAPGCASACIGYAVRRRSAADQDPEFKEFFYRHLLPELKAKGKMVLIICHDDHYFDVADRMIKMESGRIVYDGLPAAAS